MLLDPLAPHRSGVWTLDELVELANDLLPGYLPKEASGRSAEAVNQRLVRHYTTLGLLPETRKDGREVRYLFDHLLRLLVLRRLLADGFSSQAIKRLLEGATEQDLEGLLSGGVRVELVPDRGAGTLEERAAFLKRLRGAAGLDPVTTASPSGDTKVPGDPKAETMSLPPAAWSRIELHDGLELHVRDDYHLPTHRQGDDELAQRIKLHLLQLEQQRKRRP